jgi:hypothetical protein
VIEQLFGSKTRVKLLHLFYSNPNRSFYVREITRKIDEQINSVRRELANLLNVGIIKSDTNNNRLYYEVDQEYKYYQPFSQIFGDQPAEDIQTKPDVKSGEELDLKALGKVDFIMMTGQFTRDERSGIDLLLVGDLNSTQVAKYVEALEHKENKEIRYATLTTEEFNYRQEVNDRFLSLVMASKNLIVADNRPQVTDNQDKEEKEEE